MQSWSAGWLKASGAADKKYAGFSGVPEVPTFRDDNDDSLQTRARDVSGIAK
jgi:hypothetical protein